MIKVVKAKDNGNIAETLRRVLETQGGMSGFIKEGETVLLKPNFNTADKPPGSTDMDFLKSVLNLIKKENPKKIIIGESSTSFLKTKKVMEEKGVFDLAENIVEVHNFDENKWVKKEITNSKYIHKVSMPEILDKVDKIIILPCLKTHFIANFTGALKMVMGLVRPRERMFYHARKIEEKIAETNKLYKPDLIIMDGRKCFIDGGPMKGTVRDPGIIMASTDRIAIDIEEVKTIQSFKGNSLGGINYKDLGVLKTAIDLGIDEVRDEKDYKVVAK